MKNIRDEFPILKQKINDKPLVYFDNAATTQKPQIVIDELQNYYTTINSNIHRGIHTLSEKATDKVEESRQKVANFLNTKNNNIVFTYGTTHALNLIIQGLEHTIKKGDEIVIAITEHHSNLIPYQEICNLKGAILKFIEINKDFELDIEQAKKVITKKTKIVSVAHISNTLGTVNNIEEIIKISKKVGAITIIDAAQSIVHKKIDVKKLDCDFLVFSTHKMYGPTGLGILYGKKLELLRPRIFGGGMVDIIQLNTNKNTYQKPPYNLEAGTPNIEAIVGFSKTLDFINKISLKEIESHEEELTKYFLQKAKKLEEFKIYGSTNYKKRVGVFTFKYKNIHSSDLSQLLDQYAIAIRGGLHCASPLHENLNINESSRISFAIYNTKEEIDYFFDCLEKIGEMF